MNYPPAPHGWRLTLLQSWGTPEDIAQANALLASLNALSGAFGREPYDMPPPFNGPVTGLYVAPARKF